MSTATSNWALTKFSHSSFGVCVSVFSCSASNLFLTVNANLSLISLLLNRDQSKCIVVVVWVAFFRRLSHIFAMTIWWSEDTPWMRSMPRDSMRYYSISYLQRRSLSVLLYYLHRCWSIVSPPFSESFYWGILIYFLAWNLLDVAYFCMTSCVGWICGLRFYLFGHSCLHQWWVRCVSGCYEQGRITHHRRWWGQFLH